MLETERHKYDTDLRIVSEDLDGKVFEFSKTLPDLALEEKLKVCGDANVLYNDVKGIQLALNGQYSRAAGCLEGASDFMREHADQRTEKLNPLVAMANTMYAVSLIKLGYYSKAEEVLKEERQRDLDQKNKNPAVKAINVQALRFVLLQQGKIDEANRLAPEASIGKTSLDQIETKNDGSLRDVHNQLIKQFTKIGNSFHDSDFELMLQKGKNEAARKEIKGCQLALRGCFVAAEPHLREGSAIIGYDKNLRQLMPDVAAGSSSLFAYDLLVLGRYQEAEERFRKELERDRTGQNPKDDDFKRFNELGLQYALLSQGKYEEASQLQNRISLRQMPNLEMLR